MARSLSTRKEEKEFRSPQLKAKAMRLEGDEAPATAVAIGIEKEDSAPTRVVQIIDRGTDLAPKTSTPLLEVMEFSFSG